MTSPAPFIFISKLFITLEVKMPTNPDKLSLVKEIAIFLSTFFHKLPNKERKDPPDGVILSFTKFYICLHIISKAIFYFSCLSCC